MCSAADLVFGLYAQNYNLWILDGLIDRLRRLRKFQGCAQQNQDENERHARTAVMMKEVDQNRG